MAVELGVDIDCVFDHGLVFGLSSGRRNLGNALARRLITPRGGLFYDPDYGFDIRGYLNVGLTRSKLGELVLGIEAECRKDVRVQDVVARVSSVVAPRRDLLIKLEVTPVADSAFEKFISVADLVAPRARAAPAPGLTEEEIFGWP